MRLLEAFLGQCEAWECAFARTGTAMRAVRHAVSGLCSIGRRTISRAIMGAGRGGVDWSGDYLLYSRSPWNASDLFEPSVRYTAEHSYPGHIAVAFDDTKVRKTGRKIPGTSWQHDPLSPPFHVNFLFGLRFLQGSALVPLHQCQDTPARGVPVCFHEACVVKKPGARGTPEQWDAYRTAQRTKSLPARFVAVLGLMRAAYDQAGAAHKLLVAVCDGSFCNRTVLRAVVERTKLLVRCRKDARLCLPAAPGSRRVYDSVSFTPEQVRTDERIPWRSTRVYHGGQWRDVRYKEMAPLHWRGGAKRAMLRLIVLAPTPYRTTTAGKVFYRQPAYLLTTDLDSATPLLIQMYFDRWEIEVNHREEKDTLGVGQAQVWSRNAVPRQPAFMVAAYSALIVAGLMAYGAQRTAAYLPLPCWRRHARRPSCQDLVAQLRREMDEHPEVLHCYGIKSGNDVLLRAAAA